MKTISLSDAGKRFNRDWIFRHFTYQFEIGKSYAITGPNGSGKSTLLQVLGGSMMLSEGSVEYRLSPLAGRAENIEHPRRPDGQGIKNEEVYRYMAICAPYLELIEEMTLQEALDFHHGFKPFIQNINTDDIISVMGLEKARNKQIRNFSSGMKQRVKLAQCIFSDVPLILLDEPCTNLDEEGIRLYLDLVERYGMDKLVIVSSNDVTEYDFCETRISVSDYK